MQMLVLRSQLLILMIFKLEKKANNGKQMENQKATITNRKKTGSNINGGKKSKVKKVKNVGKKLTCPFVLLSRFAFCLLLVCIFFVRAKSKQQTK